MTSPENKAVFLSYASQDAEAARRICEALRAAGVEVWFDQSELRGGDAWDAKIRKQIKECALFVPVISANTNARPEGYFRLEWLLAVERARLMAHDHPFLFPIVIGDVNDAAARVPERFRDVQWTRVRLDETSDEVATRIARLLSATADDGAAARGAGDAKLIVAADRRSASRRWWKVFPVIGIIVGLGFAVLPLWNAFHRRAGGRAPAAQPAPESEARQLVAKARAVFDEGDLINRETYVLAEALLKKAEELDVTDAEAWALHAEVSRWMHAFGFDNSAERAEAVKAQAERAVKLAPSSKMARLAYANMLVGLGANTAEAEQILKTLVTENSDDWRVLRVLANLYGRKKEFAECIELLKRARRLSNDHQAVTGDLLTVLVGTGRYAETEAIIAESMASKTSGRVLEFDVRVKLNWRGDAAAAAAAMERWPAWMFTEDRGVQCAAQVWMWNRQPAKALAALARFPRDYIRHLRFTGPRAALTAWLHEQAGNPQAAQTDWKTAIQIADRELAVAPDNSEALHWKAWALARLGNRSAAEQIVRELIERKSISFRANESTFGLVALGLVVGNTDWAFSELENFFNGKAAASLGLLATRAVLDLNPCFDPVRADARFQAIRALAPAPEPSTINGLSAPPPDPKSVVVLPFANLSGDPAQEYFSDGLSDEILNALMNEQDLRVPGRTSSFSFKKTGLTAPAIARALNVAQVVEGSVKRSGNQVRITVTLTRASDGFSEPLVAFTEELVDTFAIQEKVARAVVERITRRTGSVETVGSTRNAAAHDAYLRGSAARNRSYSGLEAVAHFETAVRLDPGYALAWARLAQELMRQRQRGVAFRTAENATRARTAAATALRLKPALPEAHLAHALVRAAVDRNLDAATRALDAVERLRPGDAEVWAMRADLAFCRGNWGDDLVRLVGRALEADPQNQMQHMSLASFLSVAGWFGEAHRILQRWRVATPDSESALRFEADNTVRWTGDVGAALRALEMFPSDQRGDRFLATRAELYLQRGDLPAARADFERVKPTAAESVEQGTRLRHSLSYRRAVLESRLGHAARAAELFDQTLREAKEMLGDATTARIALPALVKARLGQRAEALALMEQAMERAKGFFANNVMYVRQSKAEMHAVLGQIDEAIAALRTVHEAGFGLGYSLRLDAEWEPLRGNAKFQQLMQEAEARADAQPRPSK